MDVVLAAGLHVGLTLDRERLRVVGRELRSHDAMAQASGLLSRRDLSERALGVELERRGVPLPARRRTIARLVETGVVDDKRSATRRAEVLAARGGGDLLIRADLDVRGYAGDVVDDAVDALAPESERARAIVAKRGSGPQTARYLARKGFGEDAVEGALGGSVAHPA